MSKLNRAGAYPFLGLVILLIGLSLNMSFDYERKREMAVGSTTSPYQISAPEELITNSYSMAGWPFTYRMKIKYSDDARPLQVISISSAIVNALVFIGIVAITIFLSVRRAKRMQARGNSRFSLADLLLLIVVVALPISYYQMLKRTAELDQALQQKIVESGGGGTMAALIPKIATDYIPDFLVEANSRLIAVDVAKPSEEVLAGIARSRSLERLRISGDGWDIATLESQKANPRLSHLHISARQFETPKEIQWLTQMEQLRTLNLMHTNIDAEFASSLVGCRRLAGLVIPHTDVRLSELDLKPIENSLRLLHLPRPKANVGDSIVLEGFQNLNTLIINEFDENWNDSIVTVELKDMPSLSVALFDTLQKFNITLEDLPNLRQFGWFAQNHPNRTAASIEVPNAIRVEDLKVKNLPMIELIRLSASHLKSLEVANINPNCETLLSVDVFRKIREWEDNHTKTYSKLTADISQNAVNLLAGCETPVVTINHHDLSKVDLAAVINNPHIRNLDLLDSKISEAQLTLLKQMKHLEMLAIELPQDDTNFMRYDPNQLMDLVDSFQNLKHLCVGNGRDEEDRFSFPYAMMMQELDVVDKPNLSTISFDTRQAPDGRRFSKTVERMLDRNLGVTSIWLENAPSFSNSVAIDSSSSRVVFNNSVEFEEINEVPVRVVNAPSLPFLFVNALVDESFSRQNVSGLTVFAAAGPNIGDASVQALFEAKQLGALSIPYASVTSQTLQGIRQLSNVEGLVLSGPSVDDSVAEAIAGLEKVKVLRLTDTTITAKGWQQLVQNPELRAIDFSSSQLDRPDINQFPSLTSLRFLGLGNVNLDSQLAADIAKLKFIEHLELNDVTFGLAEAKEWDRSKLFTLKTMLLRRCNIADDAMQMLARNLGATVFEFEDCEVGGMVEAELASSGRLQEYYGDYLQTATGLELKLLDPHRFSPTYLEAQREYARQYREQAQFSTGNQYEYYNDDSEMGFLEGMAGPGMLFLMDTLGRALYRVTHPQFFTD